MYHCSHFENEENLFPIECVKYIIFEDWIYVRSWNTLSSQNNKFCFIFVYFSSFDFITNDVFNMNKSRNKLILQFQ